MIAATRTPQEMLRAQRRLPEDQRQHVVLIQFREPVPRWKVSEFLRIHLQRHQLERGEGEAFQPEIFQPHRVGPKRCPKCDRVMSPLSTAFSKCHNAKCEIFGKRVIHGPLIGVINVLTWTDSVVETTEHEEEIIKFCGLVMDRRYDATTLAAVYRTAEILGESIGASLENPA